MKRLAALLVFASAVWGQKFNSAPTGGLNLGSLTTFSPAKKTVATLPSAASSTDQQYLVTDGSSSSDCTVGGGTTRVTCASNGSAWIAVGGSGGGGGGSPLVTPVAVAPSDTSTSISYGATLGSGSTALPSCVITSGNVETAAWSAVTKTTTTMTLTWSPNAGFTGFCTAVLGGAAGPTGPTGPAGSGGSVFTGSTATATTGITGTAAAPILSLSDQSVKSPVRFEITLTASTPVTSVTINNKTAGAKFGIVWFQPASNMTTVAYGSSVVTNTTCPVSALASAWTEQFLEVAADGSTVYGVGCSSSDPTFITVQNNAGTVVNTNFNTLKMLTGTGITWTLTDLGSGIIGMQPNVGIVAPANGGTGVANGTNNTLTYTGNFSLGLTLSGNTAVTFPTSGTLCSTTTCLPLSGGTLTGNLLFTDNTLDIGATGATRPRTGYFGTSVAVQATTNQMAFGASSNITTLHFPASSGAVTVTMPNTTSTVCTTVSCVATSGLGTGVGTWLATPSGANLASALTTPLTAIGGGTNNAFFQVSGPASTAKTYTFPNANATVPQVIASGATAVDFASTATGACATVVTASATGVASTDAIIWNANASIKAVTGYVPASTGGFSISAYPTTNTINFEGCNWTSSTVDPGSITINWLVLR